MTSFDISAALQVLAPGAQWSLSGDDLTGLVWLDKTQVQPTNQTVLNEITLLQQQKVAQQQSYTAAIAAIQNSLSTTDQKVAALVTLVGATTPTTLKTTGI